MPLYSNARSFLHAVVNRYTEIHTYTDVGVVRPRGASALPSCWFETAFERPNRYRFQFITPHPFRPLRHVTFKTILGSNGDMPYYYRHLPGSEPTIEPCRTLASAISRAAGVSQGASLTVGRLLVPGVSGISLPDLRRLRFRRSRDFDGVICQCISGLHPRRGRISVWVGADDLLIRKLIWHDFRQEDVRMAIYVDHAVSEEMFVPPSAGL